MDTLCSGEIALKAEAAEWPSTLSPSCDRPTVWTYSREWRDDRSIDLLRTVIGSNITGALYHPPKPIYQTEALLNYVEPSLEELCRDHSAAMSVKTVLNVAQVFVELHLISPALGELPSKFSEIIGVKTACYVNVLSIY